ncbi:MAG: hypothetical protein HYV42_03575 [Candidatus Magasanikbacteria bacterium]|nr:hypothetical protein [Candidatus Magasanikbacteria bacterium]
MYKIITKPVVVNKYQLTAEVKLLRSSLIGFLGEDEEGEYRPEFVAKILHRSQQSPTRVFRGARDFLSRLRSA